MLRFPQYISTDNLIVRKQNMSNHYENYIIVEL